MYKEIAAELKKTRKTFTRTCHELDIDPASVHLQLLHQHVQCCDNCGMWDIPKTMLVEPDGTLYCAICIGAENIRF